MKNGTAAMAMLKYLVLAISLLLWVFGLIGQSASVAGVALYLVVSVLAFGAALLVAAGPQSRQRESTAAQRTAAQRLGS